MLAVLAIYMKLGISSIQNVVGTRCSCIMDFLVLVESLVIRTLENAAQNEFSKLDLDMLWAMCCY